ncbi:MAG: hypothetical protein ACFE96_12850 [Candidatus Hermodarchaeota archaeon]
MLISLRELYLPAMIFSIILDYQLSVYFLYIYAKHRKEKIGLNKLLLAFSVIFSIGATSYIFLIIGLFYLQGLLEIFLRIGISILQGGILAILLILLTKSFLSLINSKVVKILSVLSGISIIYLVFLYIKPLGFLPSIIIGFTGGAYFMFFQVKLVKLTSGAIHTRLEMTLIGEILFLVGIVLSLASLDVPILVDLKDGIYLIVCNSGNIGLIIVLYGTFKFPGVPEFNWQNNLLKLYVIDVKNLFELYSYDFNNRKNIVEKPNNSAINSLGVVGISDVFDEITKTYKNKIKSIKYGDFNILLEYEEDLKSQFLFVLFVHKNMKSLQLFLNKVKDQFLTSYESLLSNYDIVEKFRETIFSGFDLVLQKILD